MRIYTHVYPLISKKSAGVRPTLSSPAVTCTGLYVQHFRGLQFSHCSSGGGPPTLRNLQQHEWPHPGDCTEV
jgi:hypothetical protein